MTKDINAYQGGDWSFSEENPLNDVISTSLLVNATNQEDTAGEYYYLSMDGYKYFSANWILNGGSGTVTLTIEASIDVEEDGTGKGRYFDITSDLTGSSSFTASNFTLGDKPLDLKYIRFKIVGVSALSDKSWLIEARRSY